MLNTEEVTSVDLNADLGEADEPSPSDLALLDSVTSANLSCGAHAGNRRVMRATAEAAIERNVAIGAHVSFPDRAGFGRRAIDLSPAGLFDELMRQCAVLAAEVDATGGTLSYVKPHGALYHLMGTDPVIAAVVIDMVRECGVRVLLAQAGTTVVEQATVAGITVAAEGFADRAYLGDGHLVSRTEPGAVVADPDQVAGRALSLVNRGGIEAVDGTWVNVVCDSLCVHSDTPNAVLSARRVRSSLEAAGVSIRPFVRTNRSDEPGTMSQ
jgi:5-oxoprolinase (ATP-hydrolysing) subunit A